jgi:hypothetical protein
MSVEPRLKLDNFVKKIIVLSNKLLLSDRIDLNQKL